MFPLANFTVALVGTNIEKCDMQFVTATFAPLYLLNNTVDTVKKIEGGAATSQDLSIWNSSTQNMMAIL